MPRERTSSRDLDSPKFGADVHLVTDLQLLPEIELFLTAVSSPENGFPTHPPTYPGKYCFTEMLRNSPKMFQNCSKNVTKIILQYFKFSQAVPNLLPTLYKNSPNILPKSISPILFYLAIWRVFLTVVLKQFLDLPCLFLLNCTLGSKFRRKVRLELSSSRLFIPSPK